MSTTLSVRRGCARCCGRRHTAVTRCSLTHMRQPNDDALGAGGAAIGIDVVLAGHDHHYGVTHVGTPIFKSGYDFETFTEIELSFRTERSCQCELVQTPRRHSRDVR